MNLFRDMAKPAEVSMITFFILYVESYGFIN